ncbi:MAG: molecular chaperone TorD family protein [Candidatus Omnitrophota bacterium]
MRPIERSNVYGLLSRVYSSEPSKDFLESIRGSGFIEVLGQDFKSASLDELVDKLSVEYTRLFIGPGSHIYPYESAYRKDKGSIDKDIKNFIESRGLRYRSDFTEGPDHISVELEFMERIAQEEIKAREQGDLKKAPDFIELGRQFVNEHLIKWVPGFSDKVINSASLSFYREMAKFTKEFILLEGVDKNE